MEKNSVFLVDNHYIIKKAPQKVLKAEIIFIEKYQNMKVEKIIENKVEEGYIIYNYIKGNVVNKVEDIDNCLYEIYNIIKQYAEVNIIGYGNIWNLDRSWEEFLRNETEQKRKYVEKDLSKMEIKVFESIEILSRNKIEKKLLHGDLGCFNIICDNKEIAGIIDPRTIVGDPIYDFIYFIFSNYNIANGINLKEIFEILKNEPKEKIISYMYILLYHRICIEEKNNTASKDKFYEVWERIEKIQNREI